MKKWISCIITIALTSFANAQNASRLEPWKEGIMDIHHINTGKGECTFFVLPDGTTLLIDAGAAGSKKPWATDAKPDTTRQPGEWIARYITPLLQQTGRKKVDYALISHFHWDHMGDVNPQTPFSSNGAYQVSGFTEVLDKIKVGKVIDRAWPDYNWPVPLDDLKVKNYRKFLSYKMEKEKTEVERFRVGASDQIQLANSPAKYPSFQVRNIAANGMVWTGVDTVSRNHIPEGTNVKEIAENGLSLSLRISYGRFDYFTGGDISVRDFETAGPSHYWKDIETPIAMVTGPVEVLKANHHGNYDANSVSFLSKLRPRVIVIQTWGASQPAMSVYRRMIDKSTYTGPRDIYVTNVMEETKTSFDVSKLKSSQGHILTRVYPTGDYEMIVLDDSREGHYIISRSEKYSSN